MADAPIPVPAQVRSDVERCLFRMEKLTPDEDDWDYLVHRLAEAAYAAGYADGHQAGGWEMFQREHRKRKRAEEREEVDRG